METVKQPLRIATSKAAQRTYLNTILFVTGSLALLGLAALAYIIFYFSYVPQKVHAIPVYLQYSDGLNPYGVATVSPGLMYEQAYDITVELGLPHSPPNLERGNFMVALYALKSEVVNPAETFSYPTHPYDYVVENQADVVFVSRRPTIIPYTDPVISYASRMLFLVYHMFFPASGKIRLTIPMAEKAELGQSVNSLFLELKAGQTLQVYSAVITLVARLSGIRWVMYNHRITSFFAFTATFWLCEMFSMALAWAMLSSCFTGEGRKTKTVKKREPASETATPLKVKHEDEETEDLSETARTFPTYGRQAPLRYDSAVKEEDAEGAGFVGVPRHAGEADDEEEEDHETGSRGSWRGDSGLGTSYSDATVGSVRRRTSRGSLSK